MKQKLALLFGAFWVLLLFSSGLFFSSCDKPTSPSGPVTVYYVPHTVTPTTTPVPSTHAFILKWGSSGAGSGTFNGVGDIKVNGAGTTVYVQDANNSLIQYFSNTGSFLGQFSGGGNDFSVNSDGTTFITTGTAIIGVLDSAGNPITYISTFGSGPGEVKSPSGTYLDPYANLYVADYGNNRVQVLGLTGNFIEQWGFHGAGAGQFDGPTQIAVGLSGNIYVADSVNQRIQVFTPIGVYLFQFSVPGTPAGMAISPVNQDVFVIVGDTVYEYFPTGSLWTQFGDAGGGDGQFTCPDGIAVDSSGYIYVGDYCQNRVQKFAP